MPADFSPLQLPTPRKSISNKICDLKNVCYGLLSEEELEHQATTAMALWHEYIEKSSRDKSLHVERMADLVEWSQANSSLMPYLARDMTFAEYFYAYLELVRLNCQFKLIAIASKQRIGLTKAKYVRKLADFYEKKAVDFRLADKVYRDNLENCPQLQYAYA